MTIQRLGKKGDVDKVDSEEVEPDLDELRGLLNQCCAVRDDAFREVDRFISSRDELIEIVSCLNSSSSSQVCLVRNFPPWMTEAIECFKNITSDLPLVLRAFKSFNLDSTIEKLNTFYATHH